MKKTDELDRKRAAAYAWGQMPAGDVPSLAIEGAAEDAPQAGDSGADPEISVTGDEGSTSDDDGAFENFRDKASRVCAAIAAGVEQAWDAAPDEQATLVAKLILQADELGIGFASMQDYPLANVRLLRLAVRCADRLSPDVRDALRGAALWSDASHPEIVDLLIEVAEAEDEDLGDALALSLHTLDFGEVARLPGATARFVALLSEDRSFVTRRLATDWLRLGATREAVPALRRALRAPHIALRYRAFDLLERQFPDAIDASDLLFLVEEAVIHPPPERRSSEEVARAITYLPERLESALVRARPEGAAEMLLRIVDLRCAQPYFRIHAFDQAWAMRVLAAAYPAVAVRAIDERMLHVEWDRRMLAVVGASKLPDELAWPRLLALAADGMPAIAERAKEAWLERRGEMCPVAPLAGVEAWLFEGEPDERTLSRLAVLRRAPIDARAAMVEVLFGEAPDPAALALLLFAAIDSALWDLKRRPGLPGSRKEYVAALVKRFGAKAVRGVCALSRRYPEGRWGFLDALSDVAKDGAIPEDGRAALVELAAERMAGTPGVEHGTLAVFEHLEMPKEAFERVWAVSQDPALEWYMRVTAAKALASLPKDDAQLADAVAKTIAEAEAAGDPTRLELAIAAGLPAQIPIAVATAKRVLEERGPAAPTDPKVLSLVEACAEGLTPPREGSALPWERRALATPGTNLFVAAAKKVRFEDDPEIVSALRAALDHPDALSSAEAAHALLWVRALSPDSPEILPILARAPELQRAELLAFLLHRNVPGKPLWPWIESVLLTTDPRVIRVIDRFGITSGLDDAKDELRAMVPRIPSAEVRAVVEEDLEDAVIDEYWQDEDDEDDGDESEESGDGDGDEESGDEDNDGDEPAEAEEDKSGEDQGREPG